MGLTVVQAIREIEQVKRFWILLPDVSLLDEWERLVKTHQVCGKNAHDARLVAAMHMHGIKSILTFNAKDFTRYSDITVFDPVTVA